MAIDHITYENLHKGTQDNSVIEPKGEFRFVDIGEEGVDEGARRYRDQGLNQKSKTIFRSFLPWRGAPPGRTHRFPCGG